MMPLVIQDIMVTIVALLAGGVLLRRVVAVARPGVKPSACNSCATGKPPCAVAPAATSAHRETVSPLTFVRPKS
jgi:hypothetical protein